MALPYIKAPLYASYSIEKVAYNAAFWYHFCKVNYENYLYINLEYDEDIQAVFEASLKPEEIVNAIGLIKGVKIIPEETVIFFDEIQVSERAITSLKYFNESNVHYNIMCAGSLLGVALNRFKGSFPVGKVYRNYLYPMNFQEFLWALSEEGIDEVIQKAYLNSDPLMEPIHRKCLMLYKDYLYVGGMPASILEYIEKGRKLNLYDETVKRRILDDYMADMSKYTTSAEQQKINKVFRSIPRQLGQESRFNYKFIDDNGSKRKYESSID